MACAVAAQLDRSANLLAEMAARGHNGSESPHIARLDSAHKLLINVIR